MPLGSTNAQQFLLDVAQSMNAVGYQNPQFVDFVKFLLEGRQLRATFLSAETPPNAVQVALDLTLVCVGPGVGPSLISVTAKRTGVVEWSLISLKECVSVSVGITGNVAVATFSFGGAGTTQIAAKLEEEADLNAFTLSVARAAGF